MSSDTSFKAASTKSTSTFISALIISATIAGIQVGAFLILRTSIRKIYAPRTYLPVPSKRSQPVSVTPWGWLLPTLRLPSKSMIPTAGLDAYMYIRFLRLMIFIFAPTSCLVAAVLLPLNSIGTSVSTTGLNSFAFGNIPENQQIRYVGHLLCAYAITIWTVYLIQKEMSKYIQLRQEYLTRQSHLDLPQSRTVLVTGVPKSFLSSQVLNSLTARLPGGIKRVWISRALDDLPKIYNKRQECVSMLESAETTLVKKAIQQHKSMLKSSQDKAQPFLPETIKRVHSRELSTAEQDPVDQFVHRKSRPSHRLGFLGLLGKKVDTIDYCKDEIVKLTGQLEEARLKLDDHHPHNSAFIEFNEILAAQIFSQIVLYQKPLRMAKRYVDAAPQDIIWDNLNINPYDERIRNMVSWVIVIGLIVVWSFPVAFIGSLSNITSFCTTLHWLSWLCNSHNHLQDVVQGILPPVLLALIFLILPMLLRLIGRYSGVPRISEIELILMTRYYLFLVIHGFVVTTLSSGLTLAIPELSKDPSKAVTILTINLPKASIFFMTYMVTTSLTSASGALLQIFPLIIYYLKLFVLASTPRSVFNVRYEMPQPQFGTLFPNTTLLATIGLAYSVTAPIMSILALFAFTIYFVVYKYLFLFVFDVPAAHETGGRFFPLAMNHVFIGLYFSQLCLAGLFFLARDVSHNASSIPQGAMMIVLFFLTCFSHVLIRNSYAPLTTFIPLSMVEEEVVSKAKKLKQQATEAHEKHSPAEQNKYLTSNLKDVSSPASDNTQETCVQRSYSDTDMTQLSMPTGKSEGHEFCQTVLTPIGEDTGEYLSRLQRPTLEDSANTGGPSYGEENFVTEQSQTAFLHPAVYENTRPVWIPEDPIGIAKLEVMDMKARKIPASLKGAGITSSGKVFVTRSPPENAEVIELESNKVQGIFALPGVIGGVARAAGGTLGGTISGRVRSTSSKANQSHSRHHSASSAHTVDSQGVPAVPKLPAGFDSSHKNMLSMMDRKKDKFLADEPRASKHMSNVPEEDPAATTTATVGSCFEDDTAHELHSFDPLVSPASQPPTTSPHPFVTPASSLHFIPDPDPTFLSENNSAQSSAPDPYSPHRY
ncbi:hypothetical protein PCANC_15599 [Puccinia coronata f. sp. avenae]|uniref:CSC1/OSCA1-like 7TM region domain-containing protein n=1 Tax=Puccinia coronata f. sp. avenae TaxID=200324 RepID=A0A2N5V3Y9_9BASI|nr:hypothetical protein PCANC_15599 [Puccinia coronata f. sp. avenae]PLW44728.1 hypothetical protein PCASD_05862 [Puccinia coronata f. sp. avenae]